METIAISHDLDSVDPVEPAGFLARLATWPIWLLGAAVFVPFAVIFFASSAPFAIPEVTAICGQSPPDVRFTSTALEVDDFLRACGPDGRRAYRNLQIADLVYPVVVGLFQASSLAMVAGRLGLRAGPARALVALPLVAALFDYGENLAAWAALAAFPEPAATSSLLGLASAAKTGASWLSALAIIVGLVLLVVRRVIGRVRVARSGPAAGRMG